MDKVQQDNLLNNLNFCAWAIYIVHDLIWFIFLQIFFKFGNKISPYVQLSLLLQDKLKYLVFYT